MRSPRPALAFAFAGTLALAGAAGPAAAVTLFSEDFDGYTSFPDEHPNGDPINAGLPLISEGADEKWYGIRFESTFDGSASAINADLAVQEVGGGTNGTPVGRVEDDAGLVLHLNTTGLTDVTLSFDWRTFLAETTDRFRVGYFVGDIAPFGSSDFLGAGSSSSPYRWSQWTPLLGASSSNAWNSESFSLPGGEEHVWVVFWLDNGEGDFGKVDNVLVTAVPEPGTLTLLGLGLAVLAGRRRKA